MSEKPQHYVHAFTCGAVCSFTLDPAAPGAMVNCRWSRPLKPHERGPVLSEYLRWKASVMQEQADRTGQTILDCNEVWPGRWIERVFTPSGNPPGSKPTAGQSGMKEDRGRP